MWSPTTGILAADSEGFCDLAAGLNGMMVDCHKAQAYCILCISDAAADMSPAAFPSLPKQGSDEEGHCASSVT